MTQKTVLAIDPGKSKCGMALVQRDSAGKELRVLWRAVVPREEAVAQVQKALALAPTQLVIVGGGTQSRPVVQEIRYELPSIGILVVDEKETTLQARERYWEHHRRRGWRRLLPATLQVPPEPVDDFVAVILAERVLLTG
jgi:RNase H-fold protein (predicted Holliday junction resolvase)